MNAAASHSVHPAGWAESPISGAGIGLRGVHLQEILETRPAVPWFELLADNHTATGGMIPRQLAAIREQYPVTLHCVGMSLGGTDPLNFEYLATIRGMMTDYEPAWVSDHLCFSQLARHHYHDLLPFPYTEEALWHVSERIHRVQDFLGEQILVENVSSYLEFSESTLSEADFISALLAITDCELLLDINNVYVNARNHGYSAEDFLDSIPLARVREIHLAGYEDKRDYLLDAHNSRVAPAVWELYRQVISRRPDIPTLIEWDNNIPAFTVLQEEAAQAAACMQGDRTRQVM